MNLEQLKRLNVNNPEDIKYFVNNIEQLTHKNFSIGPAHLSIYLSEAFLSSNKNTSIFIWMHILSKLMYFNSIDKKTLTTSKKGSAFIESIIHIIEYMRNNMITFPHFEDFKSNARRILSAMQPPTKVAIYAINNFFVDSLGDQLIPPLCALLEEESLMIKSSVLGYKAFLNKK